MTDPSAEATDQPAVKLPAAAAGLAQSHPELWQAYQRFGECVNAAGPLSPRERRLVHLAFALGSGSQGAAHSHARRALAEGITEAELEHVALLSATTLGWPQAVRALVVLRDVIKG